MTLTIFGCGYSGKAIAEACSDLLGPVAGTTRTPDKAERLKAKGVDAYLYAGGEPDAALCARLSQTTHLVQSIAPGPEGDPLLHWGAARLSSLMPKLEWVGYLSTVGVYGDHDGAGSTRRPNAGLCRGAPWSGRRRKPAGRPLPPLQVCPSPCSGSRVSMGRGATPSSI